MRLNANAAASFNATEDVMIQIHANAAFQGKYREIISGALISWTQTLGERKYFMLTGGAMYRFADAMVPVVRVTYNKLAIGVSYDVNVSTLKPASNMAGGLEVTVFHTGDFRDKGMAKKMVCPKF